MPIVENHRDHPDSVLQRAAQQDPWVMYLVVDQTSQANASELLIAATQATMRCADTFSREPAFAPSFEAWSERSFRKVTLRAKGSALAKVLALPHGAGLVEGLPAVIALPPRLRSECGPVLRSLQVFSGDGVPEGPPREQTRAPAMRFVQNPAVTMTLGKQLAQIAHAVLMCAWSPLAEDPRYRDAFAAWRAAGYPAVLLPGDAFAELRAHGDGVVVRDAGLTEVTPGSETFLATPPG